MGLVKDLNRIMRSGDTRYRTSLKKMQKEPFTEEIIGSSNPESVIIHGDNRDAAAWLLQNGYRGKIDMIYTDPPFFTKSDYDAVIRVGGENIRHTVYGDSKDGDMKEYLRKLTVRLMLMRDLLSSRGLIFIHLDFHAVHYAKIIMDEIFGEENFVNEIVWQYKSGGSTRRRFSRKHDTILVYSKSKRYKFYPLKEKSYNRGMKPYRFKGVKEYQDDKGWYTIVNMKDVWPIDMVGRTSGERTGYATQKPEDLLRRIIECSTKEGDLVADFYCGSGTLGAVATDLGRRFIMCDSERLAVETSSARLIERGGEYSVRSLRKQNRVMVRAFLDFKMEENPFYEKKLLTVSIDRLRLNGLKEQVDEKHIDDIKELAEEKPENLVMSWSVDFNYDGTVHRPERIFTREGETVEKTCVGMVMPGDKVSVKIVDIFGNYQFVYYTVI